MTDLEALGRARDQLLSLLDAVKPAEATPTELDVACRISAAVCRVSREMRIVRLAARQDQEH